MTYRAGSRKPGVMRASPVGQPPAAAHAAASSGPALAWMAPHTPPPAASISLAALTMASTRSVVMSTIRATSSSMAGSSARRSGGRGARRPRAAGPVPRVHPPPATRGQEPRERDPGGPGGRARRLLVLVGERPSLLDPAEDGRIADRVRLALGEGHRQVARPRRGGQRPVRGLAELDLVAEPVDREPRRHHDLVPAHRDREPADHAPAVEPPVVPAQAVARVVLLGLQVGGREELPREVPHPLRHRPSRDGRAAPLAGIGSARSQTPPATTTVAHATVSASRRPCHRLPSQRMSSAANTLAFPP